MVPLPPYRIETFDVLQIRVLGTLLDQPVDGFFLVEGEGIVTLGPAYGRVRVVGNDRRASGRHGQAETRHDLDQPRRSRCSLPEPPALRR